MSKVKISREHFSRKNSLLTVAVIACAVFAMGCSNVAYHVVKDPYDELKSATANYSQQGQYGQAYMISSVLLDVDPMDLEARDLLIESLAKDPALLRFETSWAYGSIQKMRESKEASVGKRIMFYPVALVSDIIDIFTIEAGPCLGLGARVQLTEALALGMQHSAGEMGFGIHNGHFTMRKTRERYLDIFGYESRGLLETRADKSGVYAMPHAYSGIKKPKNVLYKRARDYWAVGAQANVGVVAANFKIHPVQIWDLAAGIFFFDPLKDNPGSTTPIKLTKNEISAIRSLMNWE